MVGRMLCLGALLALFGCSTTKVVREVPDHIAVAEALLAGVNGTLIQTVEGAWKDEAFAAECVLKGDGEIFTAVLLAPQMRLATLTIEKPHTIRWERAPQLPAALDPEYVVFDLALVTLPTAARGRDAGRQAATGRGCEEGEASVGPAEAAEWRRLFPQRGVRV